MTPAALPPALLKVMVYGLQATPLWSCSAFCTLRATPRSFRRRPTGTQVGSAACNSAHSRQQLPLAAERARGQGLQFVHVQGVLLCPQQRGLVGQHWTPLVTKHLAPSVTARVAVFTLCPLRPSSCIGAEPPGVHSYRSELTDPDARGAGYFGALTEEAVKEWQRDVGLPQTGAFDSQCRLQYFQQQVRHLWVQHSKHVHKQSAEHWRGAGWQCPSWSGRGQLALFTLKGSGTGRTVTNNPESSWHLSRRSVC